jgi:hypothetical protein
MRLQGEQKVDHSLYEEKKNFLLGRGHLCARDCQKIILKSNKSSISML